jgi:hypothetical protein
MKINFNPSTVESLRQNPDYADAIWSVVDIEFFHIRAATTSTSPPH